MRKSTSLFFTGAPSLKFTSMIWPSTRAFTATVEYASTLPIALRRTAMVSLLTAATVTGTPGGPLLLRASFARLSVLIRYAAAPPPTASARRRPPAMSMRRRDGVMAAGSAKGEARLSSRNLLAGKQLADRFAAAHQMSPAALYQHFGGSRT